MSSKYLHGFQTVAREHSNLYQIQGDLLLVEVLKDEEFKTKSGLFISSGGAKQVNSLMQDKPTFVRVLDTGPGFYAEDGSDIPLDSKPGDILLVPSTSIKYFSVFGRLVNYGEISLGLVNDSQAQIRWPGEEAFNEYFERLNSNVSAENKKTD
jgi:co-chaperonin GroES (HSP10)